MKKRVLSAVLALSLGASLLACGAKTEGNTGDASAKAEERKSEAAAGEEKAKGSGETLTVLYMSGVYADAAKSMVDEFEEKTGAKVEVIDMPYTELHQKMLLDFTSGAGTYDVIDVASQWDGEFAPYLTDLQPYMEKDGVKAEDFIDNVIANSGKWQDKYIGIPNASTPQLFAYRTDIFPNGLPDTWEEYREELKKVTKKDEGFYGASISGITGQLGGVFDYVLWSNGGAWADEDWKVTIDSPETRKSLEHLNALQESLDPNWLNWGTDQSIQAFLNGDAAVCETWPTLGLVQDADNPEKSKVVGKWALSVIPKEKTGITLLSAWDCAIPEGSKNKDLAWEWIKMYTSLDKQKEFYDNHGILSPRKAFWEEDGIKGTYMDTVREALDTANMWWRVAASTQVDTSFNTLISAYLSGQSDLDTTVKEMKAAVEEALQQAPPEEGTKNYNH